MYYSIYSLRNQIKVYHTIAYSFVKNVFNWMQERIAMRLNQVCMFISLQSSLVGTPKKEGGIPSMGNATKRCNKDRLLVAYLNKYDCAIFSKNNTKNFVNKLTYEMLKFLLYLLNIISMYAIINKK